MTTEKSIEKQPAKRLGRGLDALFGEAAIAVAAQLPEDVKERGASIDPIDQPIYLAETAQKSELITLKGIQVVNLPIGSLKAGRFQPRHDFSPEALDELAQSIGQNGVLQPILVRSISGDEYEIIAGERRWRASLIAGLSEVPVLIRDITDQEALRIALIENIQRQDLNAIEESEAYQKLVDDFGHTQAELAEIVGKSRSHVANILRLNDLSLIVKQYVRDGKLSFGHARALLGAGDQMEAIAEQVVTKELSVRQTEALIKKMIKNGDDSQKEPEETDSSLEQIKAEFQGLADEVSHKIRMPVQIQNHAGKGKFTIHFTKAEELSKLVELLTSFEEMPRV